MNSQQGPMMSPKRLSNSACTHCRFRKKRCSREMPKCSNCAPWPGPCIYTSSRREQEKASINSARKGLRNIAQDPTRLKPRTTTQGVLGLQPISPARHGNYFTGKEVSAGRPRSLHSNSGSTDDTLSSNADNTECYINPAHSFAVAQGTTWNVSRTDESSIHGLMESLMAAFVKVEVEESDRSASPGGEKLFHVPQPGTVDLLAKSAHQVLSLAKLLFAVPEIDDIREVLVHPSRTKHRGNLLLVNHILHTLCAASDPESNTSKAFRSNVQSALNGSSLFLEPCEEHMQALFMLATHGEGDYAYPNLSWMLVGQACMQAKAIGLHEASPRFGRHRERQRRLAMFWSLFAVDKSVSLAFGRPEFLEATCYQDVPLPDGDYLNQFRPHAQPQEDGSTRTLTSQYGKCFFLRKIGLAKFISRYSRIVKGVEKVGSYVRELETWFREAVEELEAEIRRDASCAEWEVAEMMLGVQNVKFQWLHLRCLVFKNVVKDHEKCLETSRQALSLLPTLASGSSSVYNGVVWQLLYYPFTPFFLVFQNMLGNGSNSLWESDIELLESTHLYYVNMSERLAPLRKVTQKMAETTGAFHNLAKQLTMPHQGLQSPVVPDQTLNKLMERYPSMIQPDVDTFNSFGYWDEGHSGLDLPSAGIHWPDASIFGDMDWFSWESQELVLPL